MVSALQVEFEAICTGIRTTTIQVTKNSQLFSLANHMSYHLWGTVAWAESMTKIEDKVTKAVHAALAGDKYLQPVVNAFSAVFDKSTPLKLKRFGSLKQLLQTVILPACVAKAKEAAKVVIMDMLQKSLQQLNYDFAVDDLFQKLDGGIRGCMIKHMVHHLKNRTLNLPASFVLAEDDKVKKKRAKLADKLGKIQTATHKITHIEDAISVSSDSDSAPHSPQASQDVPDYCDWVGNALFGADAITAPTTASVTPPAVPSVPAGPGELQMHAVPESSVHSSSSHHDSHKAEATRPASSASTPVPVSVPAQVCDHHSDTAEHPAAPASSVPGPSSSAEPAAPDMMAFMEEAHISNGNLACSMAQLGSLQLGSPRSAAEMAADLESLPISPTASVAASVAESYIIM